MTLHLSHLNFGDSNDRRDQLLTDIHTLSKVSEFTTAGEAPHWLSRYIKPDFGPGFVATLKLALSVPARAAMQPSSWRDLDDGRRGAGDTSPPDI